MSKLEKNTGAGRPKLDGQDFELVVKKLSEAFAYDCTIGEACSYAGISRQTYYNYFGEGAEFYDEYFDKFEALRDAPVLAARQSVVTALKGNPELAMKYLERKRRKEFATRTEQEQKQVSEFDDLSDNDLEKIVNGTGKKTNG